MVAMAAASYAQSGNLYEANSRAKFGFLTVHPSLFHIALGGNQEIKIYNCSPIAGAGVKCVFTQFFGGRTNYSGEAQVYQSGAVYLRWMYSFNGNQQSRMDSGWKGYQVR
jgi:hypothetical protein